MATEKQTRGTPVVMTVTNLQSLASHATNGWQSARVDLTGVNVVDVQFFIKLTTANTAPANDQAAHVYLCPWYYDGSTWYPADGGTATLPAATEGTYTIANPNDLIPLSDLKYTTQQMVLQGNFRLGERCSTMPDGFSIIVVNYTGAALSTGCVVDYTPILYTIS